MTAGTGMTSMLLLLTNHKHVWMPKVISFEFQTNLFRIFELTTLNEISVFNHFKTIDLEETSKVLNQSSKSLSSSKIEEVRVKLIERENAGGKR